VSPVSPSSSLRGAQLALVAALCLPALLLWRWSRPTPVAPRELPALALDAAAVRAQRARDEALVAEVPEGEAIALRRRIYEESNAAESAARDTPPTARDRRDRLIGALRAVEERHGEEGVARVRAADVADAERALRGEMGPTETTANLGGLVRIMQRYSMAEGERQIAPRFVVRTAIKARWNTMHGLAPTEGMSAIERRAHWGWLAMHAAEAPLPLRLEAAAQLHEAGDPRALEAQGVLLYEAGELDDARAAFLAAYEETPLFRLRNYAMFTAAEVPDAREDP